MRAIEAKLFDSFSGGDYISPVPVREGVYVAFPGTEQDPHPVHLLEHEALQLIQPVEIKQPQRVDPIQALLKINRVNTLDDLGLYPPSAAAVTEENRGKKELELFSKIPFGRDSIQISSDELEEHPQIAYRTIMTFAASQGVSYDFAREEEPGKIVHEDRPAEDEIAKEITQRKGWGWPYYGSVDATPAYVNLVDAYVRQQQSGSILAEKCTDKNGEEQDISHAVKLAVDWVEQKMRQSPSGFVEYRQEQPGGIENPVFRDSWEAFHHADGRLADNKYGIASLSVQVEAYKALQAASRIFPEKADHYLLKAAELKRSIMDFWVEDERGGYFALGAERKADDSYELLKVRTSDMGHILNTDILESDDLSIEEKRDKLVQTLFSPEMFAAAGIRTLSKHERRYNQGAYHNGSVWPKENALIADGLAGHGYFDLAYQLHKRNVAIWEKLGIFPEKVSGDDAPEPHLSKRIVDARDPHRGKDTVYRLEQPGQEIQGWSVTGIRKSMRYIEWYEAQMAA